MECLVSLLGDNGKGMEGNSMCSGRTLGMCEGEKPEFDWFDPHACASLTWGLEAPQETLFFSPKLSTIPGPWTT